MDNPLKKDLNSFNVLTFVLTYLHLYLLSFDLQDKAFGCS